MMKRDTWKTTTADLVRENSGRVRNLGEWVKELLCR
jgi:hypothetical protein